MTPVQAASTASSLVIMFSAALLAAYSDAASARLSTELSAVGAEVDE
jgi:hypothetical protein